MAAKKKARTIPKLLPAAADAYFDAREERLKMQKEVEELAAFEAKLKEHLINSIPKSKAGGVVGQKVRVEVYKESVPTLKDKKKFWAHVRKTGEFELMTSAINAKAIKERWEIGKAVPGIDKFNVVKLSMNQLKKGKGK